METKVISRHTEWQLRSKLLDHLLDILADGRSWKSRDLVTELLGRGVQVDKKLVNSVLFSEGRRYAFYDKSTYTYTLSQAEGEDLAQRVVFHDTSHLKSNPGNSNGNASQQEPQLAARVHHKPQIRHCSKSATSPAFFEVNSKGGEVEIIYNEAHLLFQHLRRDATLTRNSNDLDGHAIFEFLLTAWARMEEDQPNEKRRSKVQEVRHAWGRSVRDLLLDDME